MRRLIRWGFLLGAFGALALSAGCDPTECGDGTVEIDGDCLPLQPANCTGEGVRFVNGRCVPDYTRICGPGTELSEDGTQCLPVGPIADPSPDVGPDVGPDVPADVLEVGDVGPDVEVGDVADEEVIVFEPECAGDLDPGVRVCIWGRAVNFIDGSPLPGDADPALEVQVKDLIEASVGDRTAVVDETLLLPGGYFILPRVDLAGTSPQLILILGEGEEGFTIEPPGETWQRAITGLINTQAAVAEYGNVPLFTVTREAVAGWNAELGLSPPQPRLETDGFLLARILDGETRLPLEGATLVYNGGEDVSIFYFADLGLTQIDTEASATGPSGVAMLRGSAQTDFCNASASGYTAGLALRCGVAEGRVSILHFLMTPDD